MAPYDYPVKLHRCKTFPSFPLSTAPPQITTHCPAATLQAACAAHTNTRHQQLQETEPAPTPPKPHSQHAFGSTAAPARVLASQKTPPERRPRAASTGDTAARATAVQTSTAEVQGPGPSNRRHHTTWAHMHTNVLPNPSTESPGLSTSDSNSASSSGSRGSSSSCSGNSCSSTFSGNPGAAAPKSATAATHTSSAAMLEAGCSRRTPHFRLSEHTVHRPDKTKSVYNYT